MPEENNENGGEQHRHLAEYSDESTPKPKHPLDKFLAGLAVLSIALNVYLAWDKWTQKAIMQPGPQVSRLAMSGLSTNIVRSLVERDELIAQQFPNPAFANTPAWRTLITDLETLPPIRLRRYVYRFLVIQNRTDSTYESIVVKNGNGSLAEIGSIDGGSSILMFYADEAEVADAEVTYRVRGSGHDQSISVPPRPRDSVVLLSELSDGDLRRFGDLEGNTERLNELLNALRRDR